MPLPPMTITDAEEARKALDPEVDALGGQLAQIFDGQLGPVIVAAMGDCLITVAAQETQDGRAAIAVKLRCLTALVQYMPADVNDYLTLKAWLDTPECLAMQERIMQEGAAGHGQ